MPSMAEALRELHRLHQQLSDLRDRIELGPRQIRAVRRPWFRSRSV